jgi:hypothetical protein
MELETINPAAASRRNETNTEHYQQRIQREGAGAQQESSTDDEGSPQDKKRVLKYFSIVFFMFTVIGLLVCIGWFTSHSKTSTSGFFTYQHSGS